jgi:hypothetical protein
MKSAFCQHFRYFSDNDCIVLCLSNDQHTVHPIADSSVRNVLSIPQPLAKSDFLFMAFSSQIPGDTHTNSYSQS